MEQFKKCKNAEIFNLVKDKEGKIRITVGKFVVSNKKFDTFEQAEKYVNSKPWELIINTSQVVNYYENTKETAKAGKENAEDAKSN